MIGRNRLKARHAALGRDRLPVLPLGAPDMFALCRFESFKEWACCDDNQKLGANESGSLAPLQTNWRLVLAPAMGGAIPGLG
jgi:hypothetical protein